MSDQSSESLLERGRALATSTPGKLVLFAAGFYLAMSLPFSSLGQIILFALGAFVAVKLFKPGPLGLTVIFVGGFYLALALFLPVLGGWLASPELFEVKEGLTSSGQERWLYMGLASVAWYCYLTFDDDRWTEFWRPIFKFLRTPGLARLSVLIIVPLAVGGLSFYTVAAGESEPTMNPLRHPTPPDKFSKMTNPFRKPTPEMLNAFDEAIRSGKIDVAASTEPEVVAYGEALAAGGTQEEQRGKAFRRRMIEEGRELFMINCRPCHGTRAMGDGPMSVGQRRQPADFTGVETIATLVEGAVFWRVNKGGIGLPHEGAPWETAMPRWETDLDEDQIWKIIMAEYDLAGNAPRQLEGGE